LITVPASPRQVSRRLHRGTPELVSPQAVTAELAATFKDCARQRRGTEPRGLRQPDLAVVWPICRPSQPANQTCQTASRRAGSLKRYEFRHCGARADPQALHISRYREICSDYRPQLPAPHQKNTTREMRRHYAGEWMRAPFENHLTFGQSPLRCTAKHSIPTPSIPLTLPCRPSVQRQPGRGARARAPRVNLGTGGTVRNPPKSACGFSGTNPASIGRSPGQPGQFATNSAGAGDKSPSIHGPIQGREWVTLRTAHARSAHPGCAPDRTASAWRSCAPFGRRRVARNALRSDRRPRRPGGGRHQGPRWR
jgi:hypothetical protein